MIRCAADKRHLTLTRHWCNSSTISLLITIFRRLGNQVTSSPGQIDRRCRLKLDKVLVDPLWEQHFPLCLVTFFLTRLGSNHVPILLNIGESKKKSSHFYMLLNIGCTGRVSKKK